MSNDTKRFGFRVRWMLRRAGWRGDVRREVPWDDLPSAEIFPVAKEILNEFYGLTVGASSKGKDLGRVKLTFNPRELEGIANDVKGLAKEMGSRLYPLGEVDGGHALLLVAENGKTYMSFDELPLLVANSFDDALQRMLLGLKYEGSNLQDNEASSTA